MNIASSFRFFAKQVIHQCFFALWLGFFILLISGSRVNAQSPGNCISFDGVNDYINTNNSITSMSALTVEFWMRSDELSSTSPTRNLISFRENSTGNDLFRVTNAYYFNVSSFSPNYNFNTSFTNFPWNNKWHHVAVTSSASTGTKFYLDGVVTDSSANYINFNGKTGKWSIGPWAPFYNKGSMDELRIWKSARTKEQIQANMFGEIDGAANSSNLYLYYKFNESSGTSVNDWSNNSNTGTLKNFALSGTTSNWIESYAGVVPTNITVSNISYNSVTLSWNPPTTGSVDNYYLDLDYDRNNGSNNGIMRTINMGNVTSYTLTGLPQNQTRTFRIRANKSSVENQGGYVEDVITQGGAGFFYKVFRSTFTTTTQPIVVNCTNNPVTAYADGITTTVIDSNLTFTKNAGVNHYKFKVFFVSGKQYGDSLYYRSSLPSGITAAYDTASGVLTFTSSTQNVAASVWQGVLRNVTFKAYKKGNNTRKIAYAFGDFAYGPDGHFYFPILTSGNNISWANAKTSAGNYLRYGCQGYLATINSQAENDTIKSLIVGNNIWLGLSDDYLQINEATGTSTYANQTASEGKFYWVTGPEKGTQITSTNSPVTTIAGKYNNWRSAEPSNSGGTEHATEFFGSDGTWNDAAAAASKFYVVEFGGMQGDAANVLVDTVTINIATASEPANSLNFEGTNDYVAIPDNDSLDLTNNYTIEAWIKPNNFTFIGGIVSKYHTSASSGFILRLTPGAPYSGITFDELVTANGVLTQGKWQHVAAVKNGSNRYVYINGQQIGLTGTPLTTANNTDSVMIGVDFATSPRYFDGNIDEVRIWRTARTQDSIVANMNRPISPASTSLVAYYNMNQGVAGGNNAGLNSLYDQTNNNFTGTVRNVANSGSTSNWVESYAMVVPVTTSATNKYSLGFVANWTTPVTGIAQKYYLDLSTASDFSSFVSGYNNLDVSNVNSYTISGLTASTTYYYRVRAEKSGTGVTTTGGYSNITTVTTDVTETLVATEAANRTSTSFRAKWSAPQFGTISSYTLDVSTNNTFTAPISGSPFTVSDTSRNITGLISNTTYYYRVRATNYNNSNTITTTTNAPFAAISSSLSSICLNGTTPVITFTGSGSTSLPYTFTYKINGGSNQTISTSGGASTVTLDVPVNTASTYVYALVRVQDASSGNNLETSSTTVTVNAKPTPTFISAPAANTCSGVDVTYTTESGQVNYTWNVPGTLGTDYTITSGGIGTSSNTVTLKWLTAGSKTVTINYQNTSGCSATIVSSNTTTVGITPSNTPITGTTSTTVGLSSQLSNTTLNGVWSSSDMSVAFVNASGRVTGSSEGTTTIYYTVTSGACSNVVSTLFTVNAAPVVSITSFTPTTSIPGNTMTVTGTGFLGTSSIYIGEYFVDNYTVNSATSITLTIPEGTGSNLKLFVTAPGGIDSTSGANLFTYFSVPAPTITSFTPTSAGYRYTVVITGTNFLNAQQVTFGDVVVYSYTVNSATQITAVIDTGSTGSVSVTTAGGTATASGFTFLPCSGQPIVNAGTAMTACSNVSANIASAATASNYASLVWSTTDGSGSFANNTTANALSTTTYTPSAADLSRGYVTLKLKANPNTGCLADSSTKLLTYKYTSSSTAAPVTACASYTWNGTSYTTSGVKTYTTTNAVGCDSVVTLALTIKNTSSSTTNITRCSNQLPYSWNGSNYSSAGTYSWTGTNAVGCDSVATLVLTVKNTSSSTTSVARCSTQLPYSWNGSSYNSAGTYSWTGTNAVGCDSVATLILTVKNTSSSTTNISRCSNQLPYSWNGSNYSSAGTYTWTGTNAVGCDSVATLILTINAITSSSSSASSCGSYSWLGNTYTSTGSYTWTGTNAAGCDSVVTLNLTINTGTFNSTTQTACENYIWNGTTYTASGNYTYSYTNANGCASVDTLHLTIGNEPNIIYSTPHIYPKNVAISPLSPINTGGTIPQRYYADVTTIAGDTYSGNQDGTGTNALFFYPTGLTRDAAGNLYIADFYNNNIRKVTPAGVATTIAGVDGVSGYLDTTVATAAQFNFPTGIVADSHDNLFIADSYNNVIRKISTSGVVSTFAGTVSPYLGDYADGTGAAAKFNMPYSLAIDASDNLYLSDFNNNRIRKITPGAVVTTLAGSGVAGFQNGTGTAAQFNSPQNLVVDPTGNVYVCDVQNNKIRKITTSGVVTTFAGSTVGNQNGTGTAAKFNSPIGITIDRNGNFYVADQGNDLIRKITPAGVVTTFAGSTNGHVDGAGANAKLDAPNSLITDPTGEYLYLTDVGNAATVRKISLYGYAVTPNLPMGLSLSTSGVISGTPTVASPATNYTISAHNECGSSSFVVNIAVCAPTNFTETVSACDSFTWHGTTYTSSTNTPTWTTTNAAGCDSIVTLNLTINTTTNNTTTESACDSYSWSVNAQVYTSSGTYTSIIGCATEILQLTITASTSNTNTIAACTEYLWSANGQTYTTSGSYTVVTNCATEILDLTITPPVTKDTTVTACGSYTINGSNYTSSGDYTQQLTASNNCDSLLVLHLTINPVPTNPGPINGITEVCSLIGSTTPTIYSVSPVAAAASYTWTVPNGVTIVSGAGTNSIGVTFTNALAFTNQRISVVTFATQGCQSATRSFITLTKTMPGIPNISGPLDVCPYIGGGNAIYTCDSMANANSYLWAMPVGATIIRGQGTREIEISFNTSFIYGAIKVTAMSNCGNRVARSLTVSKLTPTSPLAINGPTSACGYIGNAQQVTYSIAPVANAVSYTWTLPSTVTIVSGQGTNTIIVTFAGNYVTSNFKVKSVSNCFTSGDKLLQVTGATFAGPGVISGPTNVCYFINNEQTATYKIRKVANVLSYIWTVPAGVTVISHPGGSGVNDTSIVVSFNSNFLLGSQILVQTSGCGISSPRGITLTTTLPNMPGLISGPTNVCEFMVSSTVPNGNVATYKISKTSSASYYTWSAPVNATIIGHPAGTGENDTIVLVKFSNQYSTGILKVKAGNSCGSGEDRTLTINKLNAATPGLFDVVLLSECPVRLFSYSLASMPLNAMSLLWTVPDGAIIQSGQGTRSITVSYPSSAVSGFVTTQGVNNCSSGSIRSIPIKLQSCPGAFASTIPTSNRVEIATEKMRVAVYPNPTTNLFNLNVATSSNNTLVKARLLDLQGRTIKTLMIKPNETIPMGSDLKSGVYILEVNQGGELKTMRMVKY